MTEADVLEPEATPASAEQFPDVLEMHGLKLPLKYQHNPGGENDGVTLTVPQAGLNQLNAARLGWLVPGLLEEKTRPCCGRCRRNIAGNSRRFLRRPGNWRDKCRSARGN